MSSIALHGNTDDLYSGIHTGVCEPRGRGLRSFHIDRRRHVATVTDPVKQPKVTLHSLNSVLHTGIKPFTYKVGESSELNISFN